MGVGTLTTSIAPAIGPTYGGIMTASLSWHSIFLFLLPILVISLIIGLYAIQKYLSKTGALDIVSLIGVALLFSGLLMFLNQIGSLASLLSLAVGILGILIFYRQATREKIH